MAHATVAILQSSAPASWEEPHQAVGEWSDAAGWGGGLTASIQRVRLHDAQHAVSHRRRQALHGEARVGAGKPARRPD